MLKEIWKIAPWVVIASISLLIALIGKLVEQPWKLYLQVISLASVEACMLWGLVVYIIRKNMAFVVFYFLIIAFISYTIMTNTLDK